MNEEETKKKWNDLLGAAKGKATMTQYTPPAFYESAFNCPYCGAFSAQGWSQVHLLEWNENVPYDQLAVARCSHCSQHSLWLNGNMIVPSAGTAPLPHAEMPDDVKTDYTEAREIVARSPRGAAALLRLSLQKLMSQLGEKGKKIDDDIGSLVAKGLPVEVQQALDCVRVIGNNAVHPGQIDLNDNPETAQALFGLLNYLVERLIEHPKNLKALYNSLPLSALKGIQNRDK